MPPSPLRLGVVGLNGYGSTYFKSLAGHADAQITAVCDANPAVLRAAAEQHGIAHAFANLDALLASGTTDAVCIATPHFLHHPMVLAALRAGQHVFCEKPLTITSAHADELTATARSVGRVLTCHYNQRTRDHIANLRWLARSGLLGDIYHINAAWMARHTEFMFDTATTWRQSRAKSGGGIFIGRGSHLIDAALHMLDFPAVEAITATVSNKLAGYEVDDFAHATLRLAGGVTLTIECSYLLHLPGPTETQHWELFGTKGGATFHNLKGTPAQLSVGRCAFPAETWTDLLPELDLAAARAAAPRSILDDFIRAVLDRREPFVTGEQAAYVSRILEAGYRSADTGREVVL
jgi:predicted dehydrogenase